jgi:hypothetical protein
MSRRRGALYALTLVVLAVLATLPQTGWLVRSQIGAALFRPTPVFQRLLRGNAGAPEEVARLRAAGQRSGDFRMQLAAAITGTDDWKARVVALRHVRDRFPDEPAVHATLLRMYAGDFIRVGHDDEIDILLPPRVAAEAKKSRKAEPDPNRNRPEDLADFERSAAAGERLDAQNAYFPYLRAVGLLAADRDAEARAALARAASKRVWNEYIPDAVEAEWGLAVDAAGSEIGAIPRTAIWAATLLPHFAAFRGEARLFVARAIRAELAGNTQEGFSTRRDVARVGALMRAESSSMIGSLVGQAVTRLAATRPGGAPLPPSERNDNGGDRNRKAHVDTYSRFLEANGHTNEARWFRAEFAAAEEARGVSQAAFTDTLVGIRDVDRLLPYWGVGLGLLLNVLLLVGFAGLMTLARRVSPRLRDGEPLSPWARWGLCLGLLTPPLALLCAVFGADLPEAAAVVCALGYLALLAGVPLGGRFGWRGTAGGALLALASGGMVIGAAAYIAAQMQSALQPFQMFQGMASVGDGTSAAFGDATALLLSMCALLFCGAVPLLLLLALTILSRPLRIPASHAVARGFEALAGPVACVLLLGYAGLAVATARQEARARTALAASVLHEGRYHASLLGKEWPGLVAVGGPR